MPVVDDQTWTARWTLVQIRMKQSLTHLTPPPPQTQSTHPKPINPSHSQELYFPSTVQRYAMLAGYIRPPENSSSLILSHCVMAFQPAVASLQLSLRNLRAILVQTCCTQDSRAIGLLAF